MSTTQQTTSGNWLDANGGGFIAGIGLHPYQFPTETPYTELGLTAARAALLDSGLAWDRVQSAYVGTTSIGIAAGRVMLRHLGSTGLAVTQVENASASGPFAFRQACMEGATVVGDLTVQQCCPRGEGAAAVMVVSGNAIRKLGLDARRCVRVKASVAGSERPEAQYGDSAVELVRTSAQAAFDQAGIAPKELDLLELHDAFSVEELLYSEAIGVC